MRAKSYELLVYRDLIRPDSTLGEKSRLVDLNGIVAEYLSESLLELISVAYGILLGDRLDLVGV